MKRYTDDDFQDWPRVGGLFNRVIDFLIVVLSALAVWVLFFGMPFLSGCAALNTPATPEEVANIQALCNADKDLRPAIDELATTPADQLFIKDARALIDPVCANPSAPIAESDYQAFVSAIADVTAYVYQHKTNNVKGASWQI